MKWRQVAAGEIVPVAWGSWARPLCSDVMQSGFLWACVTHELPVFPDLEAMKTHIAAGDDFHQIVVRCGHDGHDAEGPQP